MEGESYIRKKLLFVMCRSLNQKKLTDKIGELTQNLVGISLKPKNADKLF